MYIDKLSILKSIKTINNINKSKAKNNVIEEQPNADEKKEKIKKTLVALGIIGAVGVLTGIILLKKKPIKVNKIKLSKGSTSFKGKGKLFSEKIQGKNCFLENSGKMSPQNLTKSTGSYAGISIAPIKESGIADKITIPNQTIDIKDQEPLKNIPKIIQRKHSTVYRKNNLDGTIVETTKSKQSEIIEKLDKNSGVICRTTKLKKNGVKHSTTNTTYNSSGKFTTTRVGNTVITKHYIKNGKGKNQLVTRSRFNNDECKKVYHLGDKNSTTHIVVDNYINSETRYTIRDKKGNILFDKVFPLGNAPNPPEDKPKLLADWYLHYLKLCKKYNVKPRMCGITGGAFSHYYELSLREANYKNYLKYLRLQEYRASYDNKAKLMNILRSIDDKSHSQIDVDNFLQTYSTLSESEKTQTLNSLIKQRDYDVLSDVIQAAKSKETLFGKITALTKNNTTKAEKNIVQRIKNKIKALQTVVNRLKNKARAKQAATQPVDITAKAKQSVTQPVGITAKAKQSVTKPVDITAKAKQSVTQPVDITAKAKQSVTQPVDITAKAKQSVTKPVNNKSRASIKISEDLDLHENLYEDLEEYVFI